MSHKGNPVHQELFTISEPTCSTEIAVMGLGKTTENIILNLVGECADA
ncbi:MAG: hypothetical protein RR068_06625 [Hafnia sp.]